uniref:Uncharacterized protein n=1 Tax=uncultured bacterium contig00031 TaxID=1181520 RepID=A0A806KJC8_9BACT|nr:hypothetical protein [uncultured bacterium contig00031]
MHKAARPIRRHETPKKTLFLSFFLEVHAIKTTMAKASMKKEKKRIGTSRINKK